MTIHLGFDAKRALFNATGLGNYSRILLNALAQQYPNHQYYLYTPSGQMDIAAMRFQLSDNMHLRPPQGKITSLWGGDYWRTWGMTSQFKKDSLQVFHGLSHELPLNINSFGGKKIVTIHDLLPWRYPQQYATIDKQIYRYKWQKAVRSADVVVAVSEQTRHDLLHFLEVPPQKVVVIPPPIDPMYYDYGDSMFLQHGLFLQQEYDIPYSIPNDYILYVGTINERKNLLSILQALEKGVDIPLVIVGQGKGQYYASVEAFIRQRNWQNKKVFHLPNVQSKHLPAIYRCAKALVHTSIFEGFGMPIAEALLSRIPVIATAGAGFESVGGKGAIYVAPNDPEAIYNAIDTCVNDHNVRISLLVEGWQHAQQYRAEFVAEQMMQLYLA